MTNHRAHPPQPPAPSLSSAPVKLQSGIDPKHANSMSDTTTATTTSNTGSTSNLQTIRFSTGVSGYLLANDGSLAGIGGSDTHITFPGKIATQIVDFPESQVLTRMQVMKPAQQTQMDVILTASDAQGKTSNYTVSYRTDNSDAVGFQCQAEPGNFLYQFIFDLSYGDIRVVTYRQIAFGDTSTGNAAISGSIVAGATNPMTTGTGTSVASLLAARTGTSSALVAAGTTSGTGGSSTNNTNRNSIPPKYWIGIVALVMLLLIVMGIGIARAKGYRWATLRAQLAEHQLVQNQQQQQGVQQQQSGGVPQAQAKFNQAALIAHHSSAANATPDIIATGNNNNNTSNPATSESRAPTTCIAPNAAASSAGPHTSPTTFAPSTHYHLPPIPEHLARPYTMPIPTPALNTPLTNIYPQTIPLPGMNLMPGYGTTASPYAASMYSI